MRKIERRAYDLLFTTEEVELMKNAAKLIEDIEEADDRGDFLEYSDCLYVFSEIAYEVTKIAQAMARYLE